MTIHDRYALTKVINAAGTFTPLGVSRSSAPVCRTTAEALSAFFIMDELQDAASMALARMSGAEAGTVTHCVAAGITLSIAAVMTGGSATRVAALPDTTGMPGRVVIPAGQVVDYGHSILQAIRLAGATPVIAGSERHCGIGDLERELAQDGTACLLLVSSRLVRGETIDLAEAVAAAHRRGLPAIIDGAAQELRMVELLATGADLVLISAQKYLAAPTAGLVIGKRDLVAAVRAQERGIGRAMKASKEAICGLLTAIEEREDIELTAWQALQDNKVARFVAGAAALPGISAQAIADPTGLPFSRARLTIDPQDAGLDATALAQALRAGSPSIWVMKQGPEQGRLNLELVQLEAEEIEVILSRLAAILTP
jgi:L-seryl-tRNA(Ser) seleniumtransferase